MSGQELAEPSIGNVIFLSYRRDDTLAQTMALKLELERKLSAADVFMDYRAIAPGNDFANQIENALRVAKVILVIIGPNWEGKGKGLIDRIQSPDDWVNKEVSFALQSKRKCVIPILMDRDSPPSAPNLPASLSSLAELQALQIRMQDIDAQMRVLLQLLETKFGLTGKSEKYKLPVPDPAKAKTIPYPWDSLETDILTRLKEWRVEFSDDPDKMGYKRVELRRDFLFESYESAIEFVNEIAKHSMVVDHHPRFQVVWKTVSVWTATWDAGHRITAFDLEMAKVLERKYRSMDGAKAAG